MFNFNLEQMLLTIPAVIIALTFHEYAHAAVAYRFGDPTAKNAGRLTLNPLKHLDLIGTLLLIIAHFGWAKPVPINAFYFQGNRKTKVMWVSLSGPLMNLVLAFIAGAILSIFDHFVWPGIFSISASASFAAYYFIYFIYYLMYINIILAVFNFLPVPPLDGSKILAGVLPDSFGEMIYKLERYGFIILIILLFTNALDVIFNPLIHGLLTIITTAVGLA